jgi:hypothetical protein
MPTVKDPPSDRGDTPRITYRSCGFIEDVDENGARFLLPCSGSSTLKTGDEVRYELKDATLRFSKIKIKLAIIT